MYECMEVFNLKCGGIGLQQDYKEVTSKPWYMLTYRCVRSSIRGNEVEFLGPSHVTRSAVSVERCRGTLSLFY